MQGGKKRVLVVDDDPDILEFLQAMLEDAGYEVAITEKGDSLEQIEKHTLPDVIILDMLISGKDGREIASYLKSQEHTRAIPIIMISAHPSAERAARVCGADDFLAKPFDMDDLLAKVASHM
ncbi:MAG: response regulator [Ktedonobacteraceae bacterium]|nr:response regulator [Ktedonobacteraceae bacterium]